MNFKRNISKDYIDFMFFVPRILYINYRIERVLLRNKLLKKLFDKIMKNH